MMTRVEEQYYNNIGRIARAMERVAAALEFEAGLRTFNNSGTDAEPELVAAGRRPDAQRGTLRPNACGVQVPEMREGGL